MKFLLWARPGSAGVRRPEASSQHSAQGRPGIMCPSVKLRAALLFSAKTIISTFPTIILIHSPITVAPPPSPGFYLIILPLITFADFVASAAHLSCKTILSSGCFGREAAMHWPSACSRWAELSRLNIANWALILLQLKADCTSVVVAELVN